MRHVELLAPARNLECGKAAIDHGADAVYIGAARFGARAAAGNSVQDIASLCQYARPFGVKVYVTVNTLLYDDELAETERLIWQLYEAGVDALIVQDLALLGMHLPPIPLHASTQMDNRSAEKTAWLAAQGFEQVVLARELGIDEIRSIHQQVPNVALEVFVHGALCVSLSGRCNASQFCFGRSANRGECAQFCRLPFDLQDGRGQTLVREKYLLSLRDMNRSRHLEELLDAGVSSLKIEGRLKDVAYVKNVTAFYRQRLDEIMRRRPEFCRSSYGRERFSFEPDPQRSFTRGFTDYFLHGRTADLASTDTPKSRGMLVGTVKEVRRDYLVVSSTASFAAGDGFCFFDDKHRLQGFRVNRVEGNHLFPATMPDVLPHTALYRNFDQQWERLLVRPTAERRVSLDWVLDETTRGFRLTAVCADGRRAEENFEYEKQLARTDQTQAVSETLCRMGDTPFEARNVEIRCSQSWFLPRSILADWRRRVLAQFVAPQRAVRAGASFLPQPFSPQPFATGQLCSNRLARRFCDEQGIAAETALEVAPQQGGGQVLMTCRYCIRFQMGWCAKASNPQLPAPEALYLVSQDGRRFRLQFDCHRCFMQVLST